MVAGVTRSCGYMSVQKAIPELCKDFYKGQRIQIEGPQMNVITQTFTSNAIKCNLGWTL